MKTSEIAALDAFLAVIAISVIILLHELGHMFAAKKFGARTNSITLHCYGGLAAINTNDWPALLNKPRRSLLVWLAGPMVNIVLAGLIFILFRPFGLRSPLIDHPTLLRYFAYLFDVNVVLAVFNLMPVFPLDGGGALYSVLRMITTKARAIRITSVVGIIGSIGFIIGAVFLKAPMLGFIGVMALLASYTAPKHPLYM
jgi:Zn-dependent protease